MPDEEKPPGYYKPFDPNFRPDIDNCKICATQKEPSERRVPLFGWGQEGCPLREPLCWEHWGPDREQIESFKKFLEGQGRLGFTHLEGANLRDACFDGIDLEFAHLEGVNLEVARLDRAFLGFTHLEGANLRFAHLEGAKLLYTYLEGANLESAFLDGADFWAARVKDAALPGIEHMARYNISLMLKEGWRWWAARFPVFIMIRAFIRRCSLVRACRITRRVCYHLRQHQRLPITNWARASGIDSVKTDSLTRRYIKDIAYIEEFRYSHPRWAFLWRWSCFYGQSFLLWLFWCVLLSLLFGFIYDATGIIDLLREKVIPGTNQIEYLPATRLTPYYFSIVTFTTLGFGDVTPNCAVGEFVVLLEVILGYIGLGGLISIFATKIARRS